MVDHSRKRYRVPRGAEDDLLDPAAGRAAGLGTFEYNQYTVEGEIERIGAFAAGANRAGGWKRWVAVLIAVAFLLPLVIGAIQLAYRAFT